MTNSSARQIDYSSSESSAEELIGSASQNRNQVSAEVSTTFSEPKFDNLSGIRAHAARIASRLNARSVPASEVDELLRLRNELLDKKLDGSASRQELNRLEYVRWSLDRIEDAHRGEDIDRIEDVVTKYENLLKEIELFRRDLNRATSGNVRRRKR